MRAPATWSSRYRSSTCTAASSRQAARTTALVSVRPADNHRIATGTGGGDRRDPSQGRPGRASVPERILVPPLAELPVPVDARICLPYPESGGRPSLYTARPAAGGGGTDEGTQVGHGGAAGLWRRRRHRHGGARPGRRRLCAASTWAPAGRAAAPRR